MLPKLSTKRADMESAPTNKITDGLRGLLIHHSVVPLLPQEKAIKQNLTIGALSIQRYKE